MRGWKNIFHTNGKQKKAGVAILISDKIDLEIKTQEIKKDSSVTQSCLTLCDPIDGSPPGSPIPGILQARTLEWVATPFSNAGK